MKNFLAVIITFGFILGFFILSQDPSTAGTIAGGLIVAATSFGVGRLTKK